MPSVFYFVVGFVAGSTLQMSVHALVKRAREDEAMKYKKEIKDIYRDLSLGRITLNEARERCGFSRVQNGDRENPLPKQEGA